MAGKKTLDDLLAPISSQLGRARPPEKVELPDFGPQPVRVTDGQSQAELVETFVVEAEKVRATVHRCSRSDLAPTIEAIVGTGKPETGEVGSVVCAKDARFDNAGLYALLETNPKVAALTVWDSRRGDANVAEAAAALYGITYAQAGIAESGTVVQETSSDCGRAVSLLPLTHIAVLDAASIKPTMLEILQAYTEDDDAVAGTSLPSQVCMITGPSATADIELVRVEGVHGPMYVHYVIVE